MEIIKVHLIYFEYIQYAVYENPRFSFLFYRYFPYMLAFHWLILSAKFEGYFDILFSRLSFSYLSLKEQFGWLGVWVFL